MKKLLFIFSLWQITAGYSQDSILTNDSLHQTPNKSKWEVSGLILVINNAFAPIPAFSFDRPAVMSFLSIKNDKWKYEPDFSIGLNGKPWMWNNWFRHELYDNQSFDIYVGINPTLFFHSTATETGTDLLEAHRNLTGELLGIWKRNEKQKYMLTYRYNQAFDFGTINGHFIDFSAELLKVVSLKDSYINLRPQLFYFNNEGAIDGLFVANTIQLGYKNLPLLLAYQSVQSIWTNFLPNASYNHNVSLTYLF